ncbi:short-chain dehydrogenase/reductase SDR [Syncephalis pseudoplumigaleata]|uniref:Peroxisomal trans-2-enoyl-CoA reductase n=1 Tax=Syncephalis pseudoplumigaleata TaxID=1712513 RepID=A0A4P9YYY5_9FUNG|nr:short-chain dehydrogenase/reductase SDR [Syncephalis pseudoplumigaleata]|eukprot:RKP25284.1 short-chain dehydrogenase/reductase SDR [Syncephalis pseudoplumigaleata]
MSSRYNSIFKAGLFDGQVALVTGGGTACEGIGRCTAHELASLGAVVVVAGRKIDALKRVVAEIKQSGGQADYVSINVRDVDSVAKGVEQVMQKYQRINILVNCAGGQFYGPAATISNNGWHSVIDLNLNGTWHMCRAVYDAWMQAHGGSIVCVTADCRNGNRAPVSNLVKSLAIEWGPSGVRINSLAPGTIIGNGMNNYPPPVLESICTDVAGKNPSGRLGTESEIAAAITFLVSPAAAYISGIEMAVDGASSLCANDMYFAREPATAPYIGYTSDVDIDLPKELVPLLAKYKRVASKL